MGEEEVAQVVVAEFDVVRVGGFVKTVSWPVRLIQTGYVQNYALVMILGVLLVKPSGLFGRSTVRRV